MKMRLDISCQVSELKLFYFMVIKQHGWSTTNQFCAWRSIEIAIVIGPDVNVCLQVIKLNVQLQIYEQYETCWYGTTQHPFSLSLCMIPSPSVVWGPWGPVVGLCTLPAGMELHNIVFPSPSWCGRCQYEIWIISTTLWPRSPYVWPVWVWSCVAKPSGHFEHGPLTTQPRQWDLAWKSNHK